MFIFIYIGERKCFFFFFFFLYIIFIKVYLDACGRIALLLPGNVECLCVCVQNFYSQHGASLFSGHLTLEFFIFQNFHMLFKKK